MPEQMPTAADADRWFTAADAAASGDAAMPATERGWGLVITKGGWRRIADRARKAGRGWEYHVSLFPISTQVLLMARAAPADATPGAEKSAALWARYQALSERHKSACVQRLMAVEAAARLQSAGWAVTAAIAQAASDAGVSASSLRGWLGRIAGVARADWLAAMAPDYRATAGFAECHPGAWAALKSDYLRYEKPKFAACYRRVLEAAGREGWSPIPSEMALRRRIEAEVPRGVRVMAREGKDEAKRLYPAQRRSRTGLRAMSVVNIDGHKFDVMVRRPRGKRDAFRPLLVAIQDVFSGKFVGWRLAESENKHDVRLAIGDMVESYGIPDHMVLDNGRAFASKWITGGTANRYRFKVRDEDPQGLLVALGVEVHWATPYAGQSKPIERAFRDLCEDIAKHPFCAGAYTGNSPVAKPENYGARVLEWEDFRAFVDAQIAAHNARSGRRTETAAGGSFDAAFAASLARPDTIVKWPTAEQRHLWMLMAETVTAQKGSGEIHLFGARYWAPALVGHAGRKLAVRFDPEHLAGGVMVYERAGALIAAARAIEDVPFLSADDAVRISQRRGAYLKATRALTQMHIELSAEELGRIYAPAAPRDRAAPMRPAVTRIATRGNAALAVEEAPDAEGWTADYEAAFANVVRLQGGALLKDS